MKKLPILGLLAVSSIALASCVKKCSFEDFKKAVGEIEEKVPTKMEVSGEVFDNDVEFTLEIDPKNPAGVYAAISKLGTFEQMAASVMMTHVSEFAEEEREGCTYYKGDGFKVAYEGEEGEITYKFDEYGYCVSYEGESEGEEVDLEAEYTYAE